MSASAVLPPLDETFREHAERTPDATAVVVGGGALTYRQLDSSSAAIARRLVDSGATPGTTVGLLLGQSTTTVACMFAALRAGLAWAVVEPDQPRSRLRALLDGTRCAAVLHSGAETPDPGLDRGDVALLDLDEVDGAGSPTGPAPLALPGELVAYVMFTSGSTGPPKAVAVSRRCLSTSLASRAFQYTAVRPVFLAVLRLSFDASLDSVFWALAQGGTVVLPDPRQLRDVTEVRRLLAEHRPTHLFTPPSFYRVLLEQDVPSAAGLRQVVVGGEASGPELVRAHRAKLPGVALANHYGPTESVIACTTYPVPDGPVDAVPIGRALPGVSAHVLDEHLRPVQPGVVGELYVGGDVLAYGYAGQPARTAERFVVDPLSERPGQRMYRTGDLVHSDGDGVLRFHGRVDDQVKVRGARVEPDEVRRVLEQHPGVATAVVVPVADHRGDTRLTAFWLSVGGAPDREQEVVAELRRLCRERVLEQAVPARFQRVVAIPVDRNGKTDRSALLNGVADAPAAEPAGAGSPVGRVDRSSGLEAEVVDLWSAVLGHRDFGSRDNFFELGGDSTRVVDLHRLLQERWPSALRLAELFDLTTVEAQASAVARRIGVVTPRPDRSDGHRYEL